MITVQCATCPFDVPADLADEFGSCPDCQSDFANASPEDFDFDAQAQALWEDYQRDVDAADYGDWLEMIYDPD